MTSVAESASQEPILLRDDADGITTLTLNRPNRYNALSEEMLAALQNALDVIKEDQSVKVVILAGNGKAFCAGHDLKQMRAKRDKAYYQALFKQCSTVMMSIVRLPQPVIARVHGIATAAGCQLVASCDLAIASTHARFAVSGIDVGLFCSTPGVPLSRNVPRKRALEMLLTGKFIDAVVAADWGLVNDVVEPDQLDEAVMGLARAIAAKTQVAVRLGKRLFYQQLEENLAGAYESASEAMACNMMSDDAAEGIDAFIEKRKPLWTGA